MSFCGWLYLLWLPFCGGTHHPVSELQRCSAVQKGWVPAGQVSAGSWIALLFALEHVQLLLTSPFCFHTACSFHTSALSCGHWCKTKNDFCPFNKDSSLLLLYLWDGGGRLGRKALILDMEHSVQVPSEWNSFHCNNTFLKSHCERKHLPYPRSLCLFGHLLVVVKRRDVVPDPSESSLSPHIANHKAAAIYKNPHTQFHEQCSFAPHQILWMFF